MSERFALSGPARLAAGVFALLGAAVGAVMLTQPGLRRDGAGIVAVALLLGYGAARGRSPAWLEDSAEAERALDRLTQRSDDRAP